MNISIIGSGAWGTALGCVMARNGNRVRMWARSGETAALINTLGMNERYLPGINLPDTMSASNDMAHTLENADIVLLVTPVSSTRNVGEQVLALSLPNIPIVCCSKGMDERTGLTPTQTIATLNRRRVVAALSGPSFAADVANGLPTAVVLASDTAEIAARLTETLSGPRFRIYAHSDVRGVELGGALKNVVAIAVGACRGLKLGASAEAAVTARGFRELSRIAIALGGEAETLSGLSGMGDLILSCSSEQSRNFRFGKALGEGADFNKISLAEGAHTVYAAAEIAHMHALDCAIIDATKQLVAGEVPAAHLVEKLLSRPLRHEKDVPISAELN